MAICQSLLLFILKGQNYCGVFGELDVPLGLVSGVIGPVRKMALVDAILIVGKPKRAHMKAERCLLSWLPRQKNRVDLKVRRGRSQGF